MRRALNLNWIQCDVVALCDVSQPAFRYDDDDGRSDELRNVWSNAADRLADVPPRYEGQHVKFFALPHEKVRIDLCGTLGEGREI